MARKHPAITRARWSAADAEPMEPGDAEALAEARREYANGECQTLAEAVAELGESTTEMPSKPGVTPEDPRLSTKKGER